jgi:arginyl-tRNA synthetase
MKILKIKTTVESLLQKACQVSLGLTELQKITVAWPHRADRGDYTTYIALIVAKKLGQSPYLVAHTIVGALQEHPAIMRVEIAELGFINFYINNDVRYAVIATLLKQRYEDKPDCFSAPDDVAIAYKRTSLVLNQLKSQGVEWNTLLGLKNLCYLHADVEKKLIVSVSRSSDVVDCLDAGQKTYYLRQLAKVLDSYYNAVHLLDCIKEIQSARLCLLEAAQVVLVTLN